MELPSPDVGGPAVSALGTTSFAMTSADALFNAFASESGVVTSSMTPSFSSAGGAGAAPPLAGSRLMQYMGRKPTPTPDHATPTPQPPPANSMLNGRASGPPEFVPSSAAANDAGAFYPRANHIPPAGPSTSHPLGGSPPFMGGPPRGPRPGPMGPAPHMPTSSFSHMALGDARMGMGHSASSPAFAEGSFSPSRGSFMAGARETPTPPNQFAKRRMAKSPDLQNPNNGGYLQDIGGTMYYFSENDQPQDASKPQQSQNQPPPFLMPNFYSYNGPSPHVAQYRPKGAGIASFFTPEELKMELCQRQLLVLAQVDGEGAGDLPLEVDSYHQLLPLEAPGKMQVPDFAGFLTSVYKAVSKRDGMAYCLRRLHNCRLVNMKCLSLIDRWKKLHHSNVVQLRELYSTKAFKDNSLVFVYDYYPGAETLKFRHFSGASRTNAITNSNYEEMEPGKMRPAASAAGVVAGKLMNGGPPNMNTLPESLIWSYVIQISSALRAIHAAGLAARTIDPNKILVLGRSRILINSGGIMDVLTFDQAQHNLIGAIQWNQQEDLTGLGRVVVALACNCSLQAASRENLSASIGFIAQYYSPDLKNLVAYLLAPPQPGRMRSINDIMPMIGARFYAQLEATQMRNDLLENELSKEIENGRLLRMLSKLGTINERPEFNMDPSWSETGDRYLLKLFRDYLFHQVTEDGRPWLDMAHVIQTLNKVECGSEERLSLTSRDEQNCLVVSYADLKRCLNQAFSELLVSSGELQPS